MTGFQTGELIISSKPYAYVLSNEFRGQFCDYCFKEERDLKRCSQCSFLYFCNKNCQINAWENHKIECKYIKKAGTKQPTPSLRLFTLIIFKIKKYGQEEPSEEIYGRKISFSTLMSHAENVKQDLKRCQLMMAMRITLQEYIGSNNIPPPSEFVEIFGKMCINSHSIYDKEITCIGTGLYLGASILNHSCDPEVAVVFNGTNLNVRMMKSLPHRDINRVHTSYINKLLLKEERQKRLKEQYYFKCQCSYCSKSEHDDLMTKLLKINEESRIEALKCEQKVNNIKQMLKEKENGMQVKQLCEELLKKQNEIMGDTNLCQVKVLQIAFDVSINLQMWEDALSFGVRLEKPLRLYYGNHHPNLAIHLFKLGKIFHLQGLSEKAVAKLREVEDILTITHGEHHPLMQELQSLLREAIIT